MARKIVSANARSKQIAKRFALTLYTRKTFWTRAEAEGDAQYCLNYEDGTGKRWAAFVAREAWGNIPTQRRGSQSKQYANQRVELDRAAGRVLDIAF